MTYLDDLAALMRECGRCGAGYSDTRAGARAHAVVFDHWPKPVVDEPPGDPPRDDVAQPDPTQPEEDQPDGVAAHDRHRGDAPDRARRRRA